MLLAAESETRRTNTQSEYLEHRHSPIQAQIHLTAPRIVTIRNVHSVPRLDITLHRFFDRSDYKEPFALLICHCENHTQQTNHHRLHLSAHPAAEIAMTLLPICLLALIPVVLTSPTLLVEQRDANPGCTEASFGNFSWMVDDFDYHASYIFTTPAHQNSWGYANFNLSNPALPYKAACSATSSQLNDFFYGDFWYECSIPDGSPAGTGATFAFNRASGQLDFNQTWRCSDEDAQYPYVYSCPAFVRPRQAVSLCLPLSASVLGCLVLTKNTRTTFRGYATVNLTLECNDTTWTNPNWTMGQIYSDREVKCAPVTLPVKPYTITAVA